MDAVNIKSLDRDIKDCVAYITITKTVKEYPVPVINGICLLYTSREEDPHASDHVSIIDC